MQNAGQQYGQGGASSHQTAPFGGHSETTTSGGGSLTASLRQFRRKNEDKQNHNENNNTSSTPNESHVARVAPHSHYPPRSTTECYRYPPQYPDYGLQHPVKYSEISEPHPPLQEHISPSVIQKAKSKEYMDMCNVQQPHMKPTYEHLNGQQGYPDATVHPHAQYLHKEQQVHSAYKPESQYFPSKDPQYSPQMPPHQMSKYNMPPAQVRKYPPENDFLSKLRRIHPSMARSIMSDHHLQESQSSYQSMDQNRMYPHHQNQRFVNYPTSMQNSAYSHGYMPYSNYPASCSYNRPPQMTPRFPPVNPHERSISPRRSYSDNMGIPMNYGGMHPQKIPSNYPQYNAPEYAQHYQHRRAPLTQEYYQQHCSPAQYVPPHQIPPQEMPESRVTVSDSIKHYIENWADEETASEINQMENPRICKESLRGREDQPSETVFMLNATEVQYLENGGVITSENGMPLPVVTSETGQYIIKSGISIENGSEMVRIVEKSSQLEIDPATGERVVNLHIMDTAKPDCMLANKPNESNQRQPTENSFTVQEKSRVVVHQNTIITSGIQSTNATKVVSPSIEESIKIGTSLPIITDTLEEELNRTIINECRKETADKNCSPINLDQIEQLREQDVKSTTDLVEEIASIQEIPESPKNMPFEDAHSNIKTENQERQIENKIDDPHKDIETLLDDNVDNATVIEPQMETVIEKVTEEDNVTNISENNTNISSESNQVAEKTSLNETEQQSISSNNENKEVTQKLKQEITQENEGINKDNTENLEKENGAYQKDTNPEEIIKTTNPGLTVLEEKSSPVKEKPSTVEEKSPSVEEKPSPVEETSSLIEETTSLIEETSSFIEEQSSSTEEKSLSSEEKSLPTKEKSSPVEEKCLLIEEKSTPAEDKSSPAKDKSSPVEEKSSPVEEKFSPVEDKSLPTEVKYSRVKEKSSSVEEKSLSIEEKNTYSPIEDKNTKIVKEESRIIKPSNNVRAEKHTGKRSRRIFSVDDIINNIGKKLKQTETDNLSRRYSLKTTKEFLEMESKNIFKYVEVIPEKSHRTNDKRFENLPYSNSEIKTEERIIQNNAVGVINKKAKRCEEQTNIENDSEQESTYSIKVLLGKSCQEENENTNTKPEKSTRPQEEKLIQDVLVEAHTSGENDMSLTSDMEINSQTEKSQVNRDDTNSIRTDATLNSDKPNNLPDEAIFDSSDIVSQEPIVATEEIIFDSKNINSQEVLLSSEVVLETTNSELPNPPNQLLDTCDMVDDSSVQNVSDSNEILAIASEASCDLKETAEIANVSEDVSQMSVESKVPDQPEVQYRNVIRVVEPSVLLEIAGELVEINVNNVNGKNIITVVPLSDTAVVDFNDNYETFENAETADPLKIDDEVTQEQEQFTEPGSVHGVETPEPEIVETTSEIIIGMDLSLEEEIKLDVEQPPILCTKASKKAYDCDLQIPSITTSEDVFDNNRSDTYNSNDKVSSTKEKTRKVKKKSKPDSSRQSELPKKRLASKSDKKSLFRDLIAARNKKKLKLETDNTEEDEFVPFKDLIKARKLRKIKLKELKNNEDSKVDSTIKIDETTKDAELSEDIKDQSSTESKVELSQSNININEEEIVSEKTCENENPSEEVSNKLENTAEKVEHKIVKRVSFSDLNDEIESKSDRPHEEIKTTEESVTKEIKTYKLEDPRLNRHVTATSKPSKKKLSLEEYNRRKRKLSQDNNKHAQAEVKKSKIDRHMSAIEASQSNPEKIKLQRPKSLDDINLLKCKETLNRRKLSLEYSPVKQNYFDWEETQSPKMNLTQKNQDKLCEFKGLIADNQKNKPKIVIDVNDLKSKPSTESSEDEILQNYKEQVESKLSTLNIQIPRPVKSLERQIVDPFSKSETNKLIDRFLKNEKLNSEEMEKIRKIISYKRWMQQLKKVKSHDLSRTSSSVNPNYEVKNNLSEKETKLLLKKVSETKKNRFRNLYTRSESESENDFRDKTRCSGDYSVVQSNCLAGVVPKLIIKRKTEMPLPFVMLERLDLGLLDEKNRRYAT